MIGSLGIPLDHVSGKEGIFLDLTVTEGETIELISRDIKLEVLIEDLTTYSVSYTHLRAHET